MHAVSFAVSSKLTEQVQKFDPKNIQRLSKVELEKMKDVFEIGSHTHDLHKEIDNEPALIKTAKDDVKKIFCKVINYCKQNISLIHLGNIIKLQ